MMSKARRTGIDGGGETAAVKVREAVRATARHALATPRLWLRRARTRHALSQLDADQMRDTGLNPEMVRREADKPFWEA